MLFQLLSKIEVKLADEMLLNAYLCVILHIHGKHKELPFITILTWFLIFGKIQYGSQYGHHIWWRYRPPAGSSPIYLTLLPTEGKIVSKYCSISKTLGKDSFNSSCTTLYHVGVWICLYAWGLKHLVLGLSKPRRFRLNFTETLK